MYNSFKLYAVAFLGFLILFCRLLEADSLGMAQLYNGYSASGESKQVAVGREELILNGKLPSIKELETNFKLMEKTSIAKAEKLGYQGKVTGVNLCFYTKDRSGEPVYYVQTQFVSDEGWPYISFIFFPDSQFIDFVFASK